MNSNISETLVIDIKIILCRMLVLSLRLKVSQVDLMFLHIINSAFFNYWLGNEVIEIVLS